MPKGSRALSNDIREVMDTYFHREELEDKAGGDADDDQEMSTDTEAAVTVRQLKVSNPVDTVAPATALRTQDPEEFYYDSDDSVLDLDEEYPGLGERIIEWHTA